MNRGVSGSFSKAERAKVAYRVVDGVRNLATILAELFVGDDFGTRSDLALEPLREGRLSSNLASNLEAIDQGLSVVVLGIGL